MTARASTGVLVALLTLLALPAFAGEEGRASWYGRQFAGRPTASGEIFDPQEMTAAHRTLPFGTLVRVRNLDADREAVVRINDRGPFVRGRIIDCSEESARKLGFHVAGTCRVRLEVLGSVPGDRERRGLTKKQRKRLDRVLAAAEAGAVPESTAELGRVDPEAGPFEVQVGAFRDRANARRLADRFEREGRTVRLVTTHEGLVRVRVGPFATRSEAERAAPILAVDEPPFVVRQDR